MVTRTQPVTPSRVLKVPHSSLHRLMLATCSILTWMLACWCVLAQADEHSEEALPRLETLDVEVVDATGQPIAGTKVTPWALASELGHGAWRTPNNNPKDPPTLVTNEKGLATLSYPEFSGNAEASRVTAVTVSVSHPDYADTIYNHITVPQVSTTTLELNRGALVTLQGIVDGHLLDSDNVYADWSTPGTKANRVARSDDGSLVLPRLPEGLEKVSFNPDTRERHNTVQQSISDGTC